MGILDFLKGAISPITGLIDKLHTSQAEKDEAKATLATIQNDLIAKGMEFEARLIEAQSKVIIAEAQGASWMQRNWRPSLMMAFTVILVNNYILVPYVSIFTDTVKVLEFPGGFWGLLTLGVGGYIAGRSMEKIKGADGAAHGNGG